MVILSNNGVSMVWAEEGKIYKRQPKTMTDNEIYCLTKLADSKPPMVPRAKLIDIEVIEMEYVQPTPVTDRDLFLAMCRLSLHRLKEAGIRHGDLTSPHLIPHKNMAFVIDFGESRVFCDPRPDKRPEGDTHWMTQSANYHLINSGLEGIEEL